MKDRYLEITYRKGKPFAAYLYLSRKSGTRSVKSQKLDNDLIADFDENGHAIGVEICSPKTTTINQINEVLKELSVTPVDENELAPIKAA